MWIIWLVAAMLGSALTLAAFVKMLHATFLCKPAPELAERSVREVGCGDGVADGGVGRALHHFRCIRRRRCPCDGWCFRWCQPKRRVCGGRGSPPS